MIARGSDVGEQRLGGFVSGVLWDQLAAEGLGQQALVEPVEQMRGPGGLGGEPVDAGDGGFAADGC